MSALARTFRASSSFSAASLRCNLSSIMWASVRTLSAKSTCSMRRRGRENPQRQRGQQTSLLLLCRGAVRMHRCAPDDHLSSSSFFVVSSPPPALQMTGLGVPPPSPGQGGCRKVASRIREGKAHVQQCSPARSVTRVRPLPAAGSGGSGATKDRTKLDASRPRRLAHHYDT